MSALLLFSFSLWLIKFSRISLRKLANKEMTFTFNNHRTASGWNLVMRNSPSFRTKRAHAFVFLIFDHKRYNRARSGCGEFKFSLTEPLWMGRLTQSGSLVKHIWNSHRAIKNELDAIYERCSIIGKDVWTSIQICKVQWLRVMRLTKFNNLIAAMKISSECSFGNKFWVLSWLWVYFFWSFSYYTFQSNKFGWYFRMKRTCDRFNKRFCCKSRWKLLQGISSSV